MFQTNVLLRYSWQQSVKVDHINDELQHPDSLYKTLNMLVTGTEVVESRNMHRGAYLCIYSNYWMLGPSLVLLALWCLEHKLEIICMAFV